MCITRHRVLDVGVIFHKNLTELYKMAFYFFTFLQLIGFAFVGLCLFKGLFSGDYDKYQLAQFISGMVLFYIGHFFKGRIN